MKGSIEQFIGKVPSKKYLRQTTASVNTTHSRTNSSSQEVQISQKLNNTQNQSHRNGVRQNYFLKSKRSLQAQAIKTIEFLQNQCSKQSQLNNLQNTHGSKEKRYSSTKYKNYSVMDKSLILANFENHKKFIEKKHQDFKIQKVETKASSQTEKRLSKSYVPENTQLKHAHQLIRSIVRVEEIQKGNAKSLFDQSLQKMEQDVKHSRSRNVIKFLPFHKKTFDKIMEKYKEDELEVIQIKTEQFSRQTEESGKKMQMTCSRRIRLDKCMAWSKKRAKSTEYYRKELQLKPEERLKSSDGKRPIKKLLNKIFEVVNNLRFNREEKILPLRKQSSIYSYSCNSPQRKVSKIYH